MFLLHVLGPFWDREPLIDFECELVVVVVVKQDINILNKNSKVATSREQENTLGRKHRSSSHRYLLALTPAKEL